MNVCYKLGYELFTKLYDDPLVVQPVASCYTDYAIPDRKFD
jgi:hypothetical protein